MLHRCLEHLQCSTIQPLEIIVVDDGSTDGSADLARQRGATVISTGGRTGPARARNLGAKHAKGDILFFIDSDVCVYPATIAKIVCHFEDDAELVGLIGSYDDTPKVKDFLSQYRNLMHCFTHQNAQHQANTFWSGCGAIRRDIFLKYSGFDESYRRPAIEDIELGYRLSRDKHKMVLDPTLQVKHLKAWSFWSIVKTDIRDRGVPWTELILRDKFLPNDLNIQLSQRVSVALVFLVVAMTAAGAIWLGVSFLAPLLALFFLMLSRYSAGAPFDLRFKSTLGTLMLGGTIVLLAFASSTPELIPPVLFAYALVFLRHRYSYKGPLRKKITRTVIGVYVALTILFVLTYLPRNPLVLVLFFLLSLVIALNSQFYVFLAAKQGRLFALAAIPFHLLFHFSNGLSFIIGLARHHLRRAVAEEKSVPAAPPR
jgi:glycosyltransferase involved in cell wall biosynthesis